MDQKDTIIVYFLAKASMIYFKSKMHVSHFKFKTLFIVYKIGKIRVRQAHLPSKNNVATI